MKARRAVGQPLTPTPTDIPAIPPQARGCLSPTIRVVVATSAGTGGAGQFAEKIGAGCELHAVNPYRPFSATPSRAEALADGVRLPA